MINLNVKFQEEYKRLDALCKDIFSSKDGVTMYINEMENTNPRFRNQIFNWDIIYKQLKHMRWIRNQLAHEVGAFESEMCTEYDIEWLANFYDSILNRTDPLAKVGQAMRENMERKNYVPRQFNTNTIDTVPAQNESLWSRIKAKFKKWFS